MEQDCSNSNIEEEEEEGRRRMETREERGVSLGGEAEEEDVEGSPLRQLQVAIFGFFFFLGLSNHFINIVS
jgi:hypothetical protein